MSNTTWGRRTGVEVEDHLVALPADRTHLPPLFAARSPDIVDDVAGLMAWWTEPLGVLTTFTRDRPIDDVVATFIIDVLDPQLRARGGPGAKVIAAHDWSRATAYQTAARLRMTQWLLAHRTGFQRVCLVPPAGESALMKMGAQVAAAALGAVGFQLDIRPSLTTIVDDLGLRPA